jgi:hypothetical protein
MQNNSDKGVHKEITNNVKTPTKKRSRTLQLRKDGEALCADMRPQVYGKASSGLAAYLLYHMLDSLKTLSTAVFYHSSEAPITLSRVKGWWSRRRFTLVRE